MKRYNYEIKMLELNTIIKKSKMMRTGKNE